MNGENTMKGDLWSIPHFTSPLGPEHSQPKLQILRYQIFLLKHILNQWSAARSSRLVFTPERPPGVRISETTVTTQKSPCVKTMCMACPTTRLATHSTCNGHLLRNLKTAQRGMQQQLASNCSRLATTRVMESYPTAAEL